MYTCDTGDDGYASTLETVRTGNDQGELGREANPFLPGQVLLKFEGLSDEHRKNRV